MSEPLLTPVQRDMLLAYLDLDHKGKPRCNPFGATEGGLNWPIIQSLVEVGMLHPGVKSKGLRFDGLTFFHATEAGLVTARELAKEKR